MTTKMAAVMSEKKKNYLSRTAAKIRLEMAIDVLAVEKMARQEGAAILSPCPSQ